ncbi:hypothetical protein [Tenacibaculum retecalamus]|uniref:hypothetical protein n=1 Tax=Tenacibaculum retecalamus TaxID=3018315 RepID=UPI0023D90A6E|nr:hypothetical protein [Tenacibaculum retecalamus]WBX72181.1 hypothetical protein PG912_05295 [Tenacibaculum retecalamus]
MKKKVIALLGLLICIIGIVIYFLESKNNTILPSFLKGTGLWFLIIGSSFSLFYSFKERNKKEK